MTTLLDEKTTIRTAGELLQRLGDIPPGRVLLQPAPGTAVEADVLEVHRRYGRVCELVEGTLVEKAMGIRESLLGLAIASALRAFVIPRNLGFVTGEAGTMRLMAGLVRMPDVAYVSWERVTGGKVPEEPVPDLAPDLAVEVLSEGNTPAEMARKRREYFQAGVRLVWEVDPRGRRVVLYESADERAGVLDESQALEGGAVLPGFSLPVGELFQELDRRAGERPQA